MPFGISSRRPAAAAALVIEDLERAQQLAQFVEANRLLLDGCAVDAGEQCDREQCLWGFPGFAACRASA